MWNQDERRRQMVERHLAARGIDDPDVLAAFLAVPREPFVGESMAEFAYDDSPLPIAAGQTISQPFIVALMAEALELSLGDRVLEVGTGSGYAAAILSRLAATVYSVERHSELAQLAAERCLRLGYDNVHVLHGDGSLGWPEHAPYDAIVVAASGPEVPAPLLDQLAVGGRLVIPVGPDFENQQLVKVERLPDGSLVRTGLGAVRFVPLLGAAGWAKAPPPRGSIESPSPRGDHAVVALVREQAEVIEDLEQVDLAPLLERISDRRVVLLGEATHGTSEFYRFRARLTRELVRQRGFNVVTVEADWPDAAQIDRWVRGRPALPMVGPAFARFPTWMWRNLEMRALVDWLREHNLGVEDPRRKVSFHGLDLYSLYASRDAVLSYLDGVDPEAAQVARLRYGCLTPWERDPALYGRATLTGRYRSCEQAVVSSLVDLLNRRLDYETQDHGAGDGELFFDAAQNARVVAAAESYYRIMYYGSHESWNLRDTHMFDTLEKILAFRGPDAKVVVWEHNSHLGDAAATEMGTRGEINVGHLTRRAHGDGAFLVGFGTDHGTVAAASDWDGPMQIKQVRPAIAGSYERLCHDTGQPAFLLPLVEPRRPELRQELLEPRLERAIGVIYRPESELQSHYFAAVLPLQFDEYVWFDATTAVTPLAAPHLQGLPELYPFGL